MQHNSENEGKIISRSAGRDQEYETVNVRLVRATLQGSDFMQALGPNAALGLLVGGTVSVCAARDYPTQIELLRDISSQNHSYDSLVLH